MEPVEGDKDILATLSPRERKRDTVVTVYDPIANTPVIPQEIFVMRPYRLVVAEPFGLMRLNPLHKNRYEIVWPAPSIGGSLELVVTERQIWLRSNHENPNPSEFFWLADINRTQYEKIIATLSKRGQDFEKEPSEFGFSRYLYWKKYIPEMPIPDEFTDENRHLLYQDFKKKRYMNASRLIDLLNSGLASGEKIRFPSQEELDRLPAIRWERILE